MNLGNLEQVKKLKADRDTILQRIDNIENPVGAKESETAAHFWAHRLSANGRARNEDKVSVPIPADIWKLLRMMLLAHYRDEALPEIDGKLAVLGVDVTEIEEP